MKSTPPLPRIGCCHSELEHFVWTSDLVTSNHSTPPAPFMRRTQTLCVDFRFANHPPPPPSLTKIEPCQDIFVDFRFGRIKSTPPPKSDLLMEILDIKSPHPLELNLLMENFAENSAVHRKITVSFLFATHYTRCPFTKKLFAKRVFLDYVLC